MRKYNKRFMGALYSLLETTSLWQRIALSVFAVVMLVSVFVLVNKTIISLTKEVPVRGGTLVEGIIGTPKFINPVLATSQIDKDFSRLVYAGLLRKKDFGIYEPDLATCQNLATTNVVCVLRDGVKFSDGKPITAEDVAFTIKLLKDLAVRNPQGSLWLGIDAKATDQRTITFTLPKGYSGFEDLLTQGIIPQHIWQGKSEKDIETGDDNLKAVGSGPYKITSVSRDSSTIVLKSSRHYHNRPYIEKIIVKAYEGTDDLLAAIRANDVDAGLIPEYRPLSGRMLRDTHTLLTSQMYALFINQKISSEFQNVTNRFALAKYAQDLKNSPNWPEGLVQSSEIIPDRTDNPLGKQLLSGILSKQEQDSKITQDLEISTSRSSDLIGVSEALAQRLSNSGLSSKVTVFERGELVDQAVRNRNYSLLVFGHTYRHPADVFAFWHSSQRLYPGLNITGFVSKSVDSKIEAIMNGSDSQKNYSLLQEQLLEEMPIVPLFQGTYQYILPKNAKVFFGLVASPEDRFNTISDWYITTIRSPFGKQDN